MPVSGFIASYLGWIIHNIKTVFLRWSADHGLYEEPAL